jgi:hypothetical protein
MLIYDSKTREIERFEPNGYVSNSPCHNEPNFDKKIMDLLNKNVKKDMVKKFHEPLSFCPYSSLQVIQDREKHEKQPTDPGGFCAAWSTWYADTRLSNPNKTRKQVIDMSIEYFRNHSRSFTSFIRSYSQFLVKTGDAIKKSGDPVAAFAKFMQTYK